jgi:hypothetical protein
VPLDELSFDPRGLSAPLFWTRSAARPNELELTHESRTLGFVTWMSEPRTRAVARVEGRQCVIDGGPMLWSRVVVRSGVDGDLLASSRVRPRVRGRTPWLGRAVEFWSGTEVRWGPTVGTASEAHRFFDLDGETLVRFYAAAHPGIGVQRARVQVFKGAAALPETPLMLVLGCYFLTRPASAVPEGGVIERLRRMFDPNQLEIEGAASMGGVGDVQMKERAA